MVVIVFFRCSFFEQPSGLCFLSIFFLLFYSTSSAYPPEHTHTVHADHEEQILNRFGAAAEIAMIPVLDRREVYTTIVVCFLFFFGETRPRVETEGMTLPQPPEGTGQKCRFSRKKLEK